jgi:hypothetical protein
VRVRRLAALLSSSLLSVAGFAAACSSPPPSTPPSSPSLDGVLSATVTMPRLVRDPREIAVRVENHGTSPVHVQQVELVTESFAPTGPATADVDIAAGTAKALRVTYGTGQCGGSLSPPVAPVTAVLAVVVDDRSYDVQLPITNPDDLAPKLHADCADQFVAAAVDVQLQAWSAGPDGALTATLLMTRVGGDEPITVDELTGSVLYRLTGDTLPVVLPAGTDRIEIPIVTSPARCDAHAMADVKFPYLFLARMTIGDSPRLAAHIATDETGKAELPQMWHTRCGI